MWLHLMFNAYWGALDFELPPLPATAVSGWQRWIDTARESPEDIVDPVATPLVLGPQYTVAPRSIVGLVCATGPAPRRAVDVEDKGS